MLVQMGYVVLFSAAFPLAGVCALANNLLEIRSDAFKLVHVHQRPFGQRVANIGTWQTAVSFLSLSAVIVNCALIGLSGQVSRLWPGLTAAQTIILIVALEHVMLGLRSALTWILPELPTWLAAEIARAEHCRHEMQVKGTSPRQTPPTPLSTASGPRQNDEQEETPPDTELNEQMDEEITFSPNSPRFREFDDRELMNANIEADVSINEAMNMEFTPDSPIVQVVVNFMPIRSKYYSENNIDFYFYFYSNTSIGRLNHNLEFQCKIYVWKFHHIVGMLSLVLYM